MMTMAINDTTLNLAKELRTVVDGYVDASTRALTARWAEAWQEVSQEWEDTIAQVIARRQAGDELTPYQIAKLNRTQRALSITADKLDELSSEIAPLLGDPLQEIVERTAELSNAVATSQLPPRVAGTFSRTDPDALQQIIERSLGNIVATASPLAPDAVRAMKSALIRAVPSGWHPEKAAREMLRRSRGAFAGGLTRAMTIARTEMLDAHRAANRAQNMANPTVTAVVWYTELDGNTCPSCISMHGTEFPVDSQGPEDHPNGRCTFLPKTQSWADLGFPDIEEPSSMPDSAQDWIDQNPHDAVAALGPDRYQMLMDGEINLSDMSVRVDNPDWRPAQQATSVSDLRRKVAS